jgi:hypothetical protein
MNIRCKYSRIFESIRVEFAKKIFKKAEIFRGEGGYIYIVRCTM